MKSTIEQLEGLRKVNAALEFIKESGDDYDLMLEIDNYIERKLNEMFDVGKLNIEDLKVCRSFIETENKTQAAVKHGCSLPWFNRLISEICEQVDSKGANV